MEFQEIKNAGQRQFNTMKDQPMFPVVVKSRGLYQLEAPY